MFIQNYVILRSLNCLIIYVVYSTQIHEDEQITFISRDFLILHKYFLTDPEFVMMILHLRDFE